MEVAYLASGDLVSQECVGTDVCVCAVSAADSTVVADVWVAEEAAEIDPAE